MTFGVLAELYLEDCRNHCKPTSFYTKNYLIQTKILPYFKDISVNEIKVSTVRFWQNELLSQSGKRGQAYSDTYLKSIHVQFSAIMNYATRYYNLPSNPAALCGSIGHKKTSVMNFWTIDEFNRFLSCLEPDPLPQLIFQLLFWTGIRSGNCLPCPPITLIIRSVCCILRTITVVFKDRTYCLLRKLRAVCEPFPCPLFYATISRPTYLSCPTAAAAKGCSP